MGRASSAVGPSALLTTTSSTILLLLVWLSLLVTSAHAQWQKPSDYVLSESSYYTALAVIGKSKNVRDEYTLTQFLTNVVAAKGNSTENTTADDRSLSHFIRGFRWNAADGDESNRWHPLGITTWEDHVTDLETQQAGIDEVLRNVLIVSWRDTQAKNSMGVRVTFVVNGTAEVGAERRYIHVLLVDQPAMNDSGVILKPLNASAYGAGIVWHGQWLYVTDRTAGVRVFDMGAHIWRVNPADAMGHKYVLPQARIYSPAFPKTLEDQWAGFSFLSLDRNATPPSLLTGDYNNDANGYTDLAKWQLDNTTKQLSTANGSATAQWAYKNEILRITGIAWSNIHKLYFVARTPSDGVPGGMADENANGGLFLWQIGQRTNEMKRVLPKGIGGLAYRETGDELWAVGGADGYRCIVALKAGGFVNDQLETGTQTSPGPTQGTASATDEPQGGKVPVSTVVGAVVGGILGLTVVAGVLLLMRRRRHRSMKREAVEGMAGESSGSSSSSQSPTVEGREIPMLKAELDASSAQVYKGAAVTANAEGIPMKEVYAWQAERGRVRMPVRKPVPMRVPEAYVGWKGGQEEVMHELL